MTTKLDRLAKRFDAACDALNREFEREFPVGASVRWLHTGKGGRTYEQTGTVEHNQQYGRMHPEMRVWNDRTGNLVWVKLSMKPCRIG